MHALEIKDKGIYLDGILVKGVVDYKLEETACGCPQINMTLVVENAKVTPKEEPEVISPGSALKELIEHITGDEVKAAKVYYGVTASKPDISEQIRQIVREELAAHEERLNMEPIKIGISEEMKREIIPALNAVLREAQSNNLIRK